MCHVYIWVCNHMTNLKMMSQTVRCQGMRLRIVTTEISYRDLVALKICYCSVRTLQGHFAIATDAYVEIVNVTYTQSDEHAL